MPGSEMFTVDRDRCIGSGMCSVYAPATFSQDSEAKVVVLDPHGDSSDAIRTAVESCPTRALTLLESDIQSDEVAEKPTRER
jgi:ferredoxin